MKLMTRVGKGEYIFNPFGPSLTESLEKIKERLEKIWDKKEVSD